MNLIYHSQYALQDNSILPLFTMGGMLTLAMDVQAAVLVAHTAIGPHDDFIQEVLNKLALFGYVAFALDLFVIIQSPQARKPLDRMCVHAGDGQTYLVRVDSMS